MAEACDEHVAKTAERSAEMFKSDERDVLAVITRQPNRDEILEGCFLRGVDAPEPYSQSQVRLTANVQWSENRQGQAPPF